MRFIVWFVLIVFLLTILFSSTAVGLLLDGDDDQPPVRLACNDTVDNCDILNSTLGICNKGEEASVVCKAFCGLCPVDGAWSAWEAWSSCDVKCGNGTRMRERQCDNPVPAKGGNNCTGNSNETKPCITGIDICPVDGGWSSWTSWTDCTVSCGTGLKHRNRQCDNPKPSDEGDYCQGDNIEYDICKEGACPAGWSAWSIWSECSVSCGTGLKHRDRYCFLPILSANDEDVCPGDSTDYTICEDRLCSLAMPAFFATNIKSGSGIGNVAFSTVYLNDGSDYNSTTGRFTCSIGGLYYFSATLGKTPESEFAHCYFMKNTDRYNFINVNPTHVDDGYYSASASVVFRLNVGDQFYLGNCSPTENFSSDACSFAGFLIRPQP